MRSRASLMVRALSCPAQYRKDPMARSGRGRPTLEQVALRAGVSRATASRVVNGSPRVAPDIQEAVRKAIAELGYFPNTAARSLVTQRTGLYALVVPEPASRVFSSTMM